MTRRLITLLSLIILAGCASTGGSASDATGSSSASGRPAAVGSECKSDSVAALAGTAYSDSLAQRAQRQSGSTVLRVLRPGELMTLEYNPQRLTIVIDDDGKIASIRCG